MGNKQILCGEDLALYSHSKMTQRRQAAIPRGQLEGVIACEHKVGELAIKGTHVPVKNIQAQRGYVFQAIRVNVKFWGVFRLFLYGVYQFICRRGVEVAFQFQAKAVANFIDGYFEIGCHSLSFERGGGIMNRALNAPHARSPPTLSSSPVRHRRPRPSSFYASEATSVMLKNAAAQANRKETVTGPSECSVDR
jgi:hypothetical protein